MAVTLIRADNQVRAPGSSKEVVFHGDTEDTLASDSDFRYDNGTLILSGQELSPRYSKTATLLEPDKI